MSQGLYRLSYAATQGQSGNRTHDVGFADQCLQPLGYLTGFYQFSLNGQLSVCDSLFTVYWVTEIVPTGFVRVASP